MRAFFFTIILSIAPISEVRGAIPYALANDVPMPWALLIPFLANASIVPILYMIVRPLFAFFRQNFGRVGRWVDRFENRATAKLQKYRKYTLVGLFLLVAIPLPTTGVYTGVVAAVVAQIPARVGIFSIIAGTAVASIITYLATIGVLEFLNVIL